MVDVLIKKLLEAGVHFGHQARRWNPKMKKFIFGERSNIYIIDLEKTAECLNVAQDFIYDIASKGGRVLFVGTKKQAQDVIEQEAKRCGMYYVTNRWLGGFLTNYETVKQSINRLKSLEQMAESGIMGNLTKKEVNRLTKEKEKLQRELNGIRDMGKLPDAVLIVDTKKEEISVREANRLNIPIIGLIDTNCDPDFIQYPIPCNDDALKSIQFITSMIADTIMEGRKQYVGVEQVAIRKQNIPAQETTINDSTVTSASPEKGVVSTKRKQENS